MRPSSRPINIGVEAAIRKMGGQKELGSALGLEQPTISGYLRGLPPILRTLQIERLTGVPRHLLRPDKFHPNGEVAE